MTVKDLKIQMLEAYTAENLNKISLTLINLFTAKQYSVLQKISEILSDYINIRISDLSPLSGLTELEELNLSDNQINRRKMETY